MNRMRLKALLSSLLFLLFLAISVTGAMLYFGKTGLILGFRRIALLRFHGCCSFAFFALALCHITLNLRLYAQEAKKLFPGSKSKRR